MKTTSIEYNFDNGATVTFVVGCKELCKVEHSKYFGRPYFYTVIIENKNGRQTIYTFASPSQVVAKNLLLNSLMP